MAKRILVADDSPIVRRCLVRLFRSHEGWEVCGEATDGEDAVCKARKLAPDLVVLDFMMPGKNGIEAAREILKYLPRTSILLCTAFLLPHLVDLARATGIAGAVCKGDVHKLVACAEAVLHGGTFFLKLS